MLDDAYPRFVSWVYVGISNRKALSMAIQYTEIVKQFGSHPAIPRSDRGKETALLREVQFALAQNNTPGTTVDNCHFYVASRKNQRIESWSF